MKIAVFSIPDIHLGKHNIKDARLDEVDKAVKAKKKTYVQVEITGEDSASDADAILTASDARCEVILQDLEFVETRLSRCEEEPEKTILNRLKSVLENEEIIFNAGLNEEERRLISGYGLLSNKPVIAAEGSELADLNSLLARVVRESGLISFFTTVGEKEARAWLIKQGTTAWQAAGAVHSDIQKGFIRAEIISFADFMQAGALTAARQAGKMRLEQKDYIVQDADIITFRFNK